MAVVSKSYLLEAGCHFGHQTKRWNPKMKEYIFTSRDDVHIIDLDKTMAKLEEAYKELAHVCENGGKALYVGTKKQAQEACMEEALRSDSYYVTERWLGGTLTNFKTIRDRVRRLDEIEALKASGKLELLPKKEVAKINKEYDKLNKILAGIRAMTTLPKAVVIVDPRIEINAIHEAKKLGIPVFGIVDTNSDPDEVDFVIPGNDDAVRSVKVILGVLNNAVCETNNKELVDYVTEEEFARPRKERVSDEVNVIEKEVTFTNIQKPEVRRARATMKEEDIVDNKLDKMKLADLKALAKDRGIKGYSTMKKEELLLNLK